MEEIKQFNETGTVFGSVSKSDFEAFKITVPAIDVVERFQEIIKPIDDKVITNCHQIRTLEKLMTRLTESAIEEFAIQLFEQLGYQYIYAPDIAPDGDRPERTRYDEVVLTDRLNSAVQRINPKIPEFARQQAVKDILRIQSPETLANNETFHRFLTEGVNVSYSHDNQERGDLVWLIDFANQTT